MVKNINLPLSEHDVRELSAGDIVRIYGNIVTGRDRVHKFLLETKDPAMRPPFDLQGAVLYHCGPVVKKTDEGYTVVAAGPTTSMRMEVYEPLVIARYGLRGIMGKGGMGDKTREALKDHGCVYLNTIGGAAVVLAEKIKSVRDVWQLDAFGPTEAMWLLEIADFPAVVTMDTHGNDIHREIERESLKIFTSLISS